jgi:CheY-like chemotaxis protein
MRDCIIKQKDSMGNECEILVADDEVSLIHVLKRELSAVGYHVHTAHDGQEAIDTIKRVPIDLIVLDLKMPGVDGFEVLIFVKELYPQIKVIVLTGHSDLGNAIRCKKLGADQFLEKPYNLNELFIEIRRLMPVKEKTSLN